MQEDSESVMGGASPARGGGAYEMVFWGASGGVLMGELGATN